MVRKFKAYFETLEGLSTKALDQSAEKLVRAEKQNVALVIAHIAEISRRKADLECGYRNLFDYAVRRLHLSEGSVALRIQVANVSRRFPQILVALAESPDNCQSSQSPGLDPRQLPFPGGWRLVSNGRHKGRRSGQQAHRREL